MTLERKLWVLGTLWNTGVCSSPPLETSPGQASGSEGDNCAARHRQLCFPGLMFALQSASLVTNASFAAGTEKKISSDNKLVLQMNPQQETLGSWTSAGQTRRGHRTKSAAPSSCRWLGVGGLEHGILGIYPQVGVHVLRVSLKSVPAPDYLRTVRTRKGRWLS